jgi:hypothetical protein
MERLIPKRFYSIRQAVRHTPNVKSRAILNDYVEKGLLKHVRVGNVRGKRFLIKGEWLKDFNKHFYERKAARAEAESVLYLSVEDIDRIARNNNLMLIEELINYIKERNEKEQEKLRAIAQQGNIEQLLPTG